MNNSHKQQGSLADVKICITAQGLPDDVYNVWNDLQNNIQLIDLCIVMDGENVSTAQTTNQR
jgi:hypothetical protein